MAFQFVATHVAVAEGVLLKILYSRRQYVEEIDRQIKD